MKRTHLTLLALLGLTLAGSIQAQQLSPEVFRSVVVETVLPFTVQQYTPNFALPLPTRQSDADYTTPERAIAAFFGSLKAANYGWNEATWTPPSTELNRKRNSEAGKGAADWEQRWRAQYGDKTIELLHRVAYDRYVILEYRVLVPATGHVSETDTLALEKLGDGSWRVTQALASNPITYAWKQPSARVQVGPNTVGRLSKERP